jgi:raffinose/stachyose/melibiose transport system permease protein
MTSKKRLVNTIFTVVLSILSLAYVYPVFMILINTFKEENSITTEGAFTLPTAETFDGLTNYINAIQAQGFLKSLGYSLFITISSVAAILLFCSMCAWYLARVKSVFSTALYYLCVFSMVVPFQMVMYTLASTADTLKLNTPWNIWVIYLGFGSGLAVFMITGFMKSVPLEIEEAAMIDGCSPIKSFFYVVFPILKPTAITVAILNAMWIWNDFLLPYLLLGSGNKTLSVAIQLAMQGAYGAIDWGGFMAMLVLSVIPIIIFYLLCQKYIIKGVIDGAVKG